MTPSPSTQHAQSEQAPDLASFFPVPEVGKHLPRRANGRPLHPKVALRWCLQGSHGVRLRYIAAGRQKLTTNSWLIEFCAAVAEAQQRAAGGEPAARSSPAATTTPRARRGDHGSRRERTRRSLAAAGFRA